MPNKPTRNATRKPLLVQRGWAVRIFFPWGETKFMASAGGCTLVGEYQNDIIRARKDHFMHPDLKKDSRIVPVEVREILPARSRRKAKRG